MGEKALAPTHCSRLKPPAGSPSFTEESVSDDGQALTSDNFRFTPESGHRVTLDLNYAARL
jgi:hypothetical protein